MKGLNVGLAVAFHLLVGLGFLVFAQAEGLAGGHAWLAALLWLGGLFLQLDARDRAPGAIWLVPVIWPFAAWVAAFGVLVLIGGLAWLAFSTRATPAPAPPSSPQAAAHEAKLRAVEATLATLEAQLRELTRPPAPVAVPPTPAPAPRPAPATAPPSALRTALDRDVAWSDLLGARALAWAGGVVTVLGILFFFVLAANRGWLLPEIRVLLGASASAAAFGAGFWMRQRFGSLHSAVAAAGAGIAGAYGTLLAATALYGFVSQGWALLVAAGIAAAGAATALAWSSEIVAGLGLVGATLVPLAVLQEGELSFVGTAFAGVMLAGNAAVSLRARWRDILLLGGAASLVQIAGLAAQTGGFSARVFWLAAAFWLLYLGVGLAWQLRYGARSLEPLAGVFVITGGALAAYSCLFLLDERAGMGLLAATGLYAILAAFYFRVDRERDLAGLLAAVACVLGAIAAAELIAGAPLTFVWAAVAALLAWLAQRAREPRLLFPALAYAALATGYALIVEGSPRLLFLDSSRSAAASLAVAGAAAALAGFGWFSRTVQTSRQPGSPVGRALDEAATYLSRDSRPYFWASAGLALYAASLAVVDAFQQADEFDWGHVALTGLWGGVALALVAAGVRAGRGFDVAGLALIAWTALEALAFDAVELERVWGTSFLIVAGAAMLTCFEYGRRSTFAWRLLPAAAGAVAGALFAAAGLHDLATGSWNGVDVYGGTLVLAGAAYLALATVAFPRQRDLSTAYWSTGLALGALALPQLLSGTWLVVAGAAASAGLVGLGRLVEEDRLELAGLTAFGCTLLFTLAEQAPPSDLFVAASDPGWGALAVLPLIAAAWAGAAAFSLRRFRVGALVTAGVLALYALSLGTLELLEQTADFGWGHVALTGLWSGVALALLEAGLRLDRRELEITAAGLFAFSVSEAVAFDWSELAEDKAATGFLLLAAISIAGAMGYDRRSAVRERVLLAGAALVVGAALAAAGVAALAKGSWGAIDVEGAAFVFASLAYAAVAAATARRRRDVATVLGGIALVFAGVGLVELVSGFWLVLAGSAFAACLYLLGEAVAEERIRFAGLGVYALTLGYALVMEAPPRDFFVESAHPGAGLPSLLVLVATGALIAWRPEVRAHVHAAAGIAVAVLSFYAVSLGLLEIAEVATSADIGTKFQRGHTAVSLFWGLVGMGLLYLGLTRRRRELRLAGFGLFGISLAKLFLYDLTFLSSLARALSFLAVGAALLFAGFFYQRLSEGLEHRDGAGRAA